MKRRDFLAASTALLALLGQDALAAPRRKPAAKAQPARKPGKSPAPKKSAGPAARTAYTPVTDKPPEGSSASRLPPVKAPEAPTDWRNFEITTTVTLPKSSGATRLWLPLPLNQDTLFQRTVAHRWKSNAAEASLRRLPEGDLETFVCEWPGGIEPRLELTTTVATADRHFDIARRTMAPEREDILRRNLQSSQQIPNDGPAHALAERIVGRVRDPVAQAKAIYDWIVDNVNYFPEQPAGGLGNVRSQFDSGQFGGRSADINGLFVALCRAIGIPARCVYGLRVGSSRLFRSLGVNDDNATLAQHCRAEFYVPGYSWIPVDPSDVRRAIVIEGLSDRDSKLQALRRILFGVWEMNWVAYNIGADLTLPNSSQRVPNFFLPRVENGEGLRDGRDPASFKFSINARQSFA